MNVNNLVPAHSLAFQYGVKMIGYGPPGSGKTPAVKTAPRPVIGVCEPGMMTMRDSNLPAFAMTTPAAIKEFFDWTFNSRECDQFDTICIDSVSEMAELVLAEEMRMNKDPRRSYGRMSERCMEWLNGLFFMKNKHVYLIAKQSYHEEIVSSIVNGVPSIENIKRAEPYFPGQDLPMKVSHRYDLIAQCNKGTIPGVPGGPHSYFRCTPSQTIHARDRSGKLAEYEPLDLSALFKKAMS